MKVTNEEGVKHLWRRMLRRLKTKESSSNKKTSIDEYSTDADYPSAKAVYGFVNDKVEEKTAICRGTFLSQSLLPNKSICPDLKHGDYAFVNGDNNLGPNTNHYNYVETPKITLNSDTRTYTFKEQVSNEGATFPYKWGGGAGANYREVYTAVKFPGNGSKAASSYDIPVDDAEYTVYDHTVHGGWVFTRALGNGAVPATHIQDTAAQSTNLALVMGATGQFGQEEINEVLAGTTDPLTSQAVDDLLAAAETAENEESAPVAFNSDFANFIIAAIKADIIENVIEISTNVTSTCTITGAANNGHCQTIIYRNITETVENPDYDENDPTSEQYLSEETDLYVSIPSNFVTPGGTQIVLLCPIGGYCEVSYLNVNGTIYARGL